MQTFKLNVFLAFKVYKLNKRYKCMHLIFKIIINKKKKLITLVIYYLGTQLM